MNKTKFNISIPMTRYTCYLVAILLIVCGIMYLLSSCITEIIDPNARSNGSKVAVNFSLRIGSHGSDEVVERSGFSADEPITAFVHVAHDVYMYATLEPESPVTTRAMTTNLPDNYRVRVVAYYSDNTIAAQEDYQVIGGKLTGNNFEVAEDNTCTFVAYSLNESTLPTQNASNEITFTVSAYPNLDLLWGSTNPIYIDGSGTTAEIIELKHLFSRIKVEVSSAAIISDPVIEKIENASVSPHYNGTATLNVLTGKLTPQGDPAGLQLTRWRDQDIATFGSAWKDGGITPAGVLQSTDVESDYCYIFKHESDTLALKIGDLVVDGIDLGSYELRFSSTKLLSGHSYVLKLTFKRLVWAGSNIFWDGNRLTFLPETTPEFLQGYQGVYFFWGSLIGISPVGTATAGQTTGAPGNFVTTNNTGTRLFVPPSVSPNRPNWTTAFAASTNNSTTKPWSGNTIDAIPRVQAGASLYSPVWLDDHSSRNYLYEIHDTVSFRGDICRYLSERRFAPPGHWRMPNGKELGHLASEYAEHTLSASMPATVLISGMSDFYNDVPSSYATKLVSSTVFPAGGSRESTGTFLTVTQYFSGSPANNSGNPGILNACFSLRLSGASNPAVAFNLARIGTPGIQGLVRCVKLDAAGIPPTFLDVFLTGDIVDWESGGTFGTGSQGEIWY